jgi:hypothetical protein
MRLKLIKVTAWRGLKMGTPINTAEVLEEVRGIIHFGNACYYSHQKLFII